MDERFRDALRRNALLSEVLAEGYQPSADAALRSRLHQKLARVRRRRIGVFSTALAGAALLAFALLGRAPDPVSAPPVPTAAPAPLMEVVSTETARPRIAIVRTASTSWMEIVRSEASPRFMDVARDEDLLRSPRVLAIVGHPGAPKRLLVAP